ncbi:hypothetical protein IT402_00710 [Candidatus Nomurabacteria bacterium]|nr:hypothetical protein [Candidatus Nomurabacteria bacterium]
MEQTKITLSNQHLYSPILADFFTFLVEEDRKNNVLCKSESNKTNIENLTADFLKKAMEDGNTKLGDRGDVYAAGEITFGFPIIRKEDLILEGYLLEKIEKDVLFNVLDHAVQELKQLAALKYAKMGGGFTRMAVPPAEAFLYEDHSGNISLDHHSVSILRRIEAKGPPYPNVRVARAIKILNGEIKE